ncbi:hypothetical protein CC2G_012422 [Coprinopsis cinerea AmutBmut pab1-1]|nr:hypothetical protein CC2G_012422 [Coprinopsis cinerea AmutBmut pab1-1]
MELLADVQSGGFCPIWFFNARMSLISFDSRPLVLEELDNAVPRLVVNTAKITPVHCTRVVHQRFRLIQGNTGSLVGATLVARRSSKDGEIAPKPCWLLV